MPGWNQPTVVGLSPVSPSVGYPPGGGAFPGFVSTPAHSPARGLEQIALAKVRAKLAEDAATAEAKRAEAKAKTALHERMMMKGWEKGEDWMGEGPEPIAEDMGYRKGPYGGQWKPPKPEIISAGGQQLLRTGATTYTILKPNTHVTTQVDEKGNVTLLGINKDTGTETFKKTYKGMGRPGRTGIQIGDIGPRITATEKAKAKAFLSTPAFRTRVINDVKKLHGGIGGSWDIAEPVERSDMIRGEADKQVRRQYPNAEFGEGTGNHAGLIGWFDKTTKEFLVPWSE